MRKGGNEAQYYNDHSVILAEEEESQRTALISFFSTSPY